MFAYKGDILFSTNFPSDRFCFNFFTVASESQHTTRQEEHLILRVFFFRFSHLFSFLSLRHIRQQSQQTTHTGQMHDADETTPRWIVSRIQFHVRDFCSDLLSALGLLLINRSQPAENLQSLLLSSQHSFFFL